MTRRLNNSPTWVYRLTCSHERLLYVGIAHDVDRRLAQHAATKDWWQEVAFVDAERFPTRMTALKVEAFHIVYERPPYNFAGLPKLPQRPGGEPIGHRFYIAPPSGVELQGVRGDWR